MTLIISQIIRMDDGRYSWSADFEDSGFNQDGYVRTFGEAQECIAGAVENATVELCFSRADVRAVEIEAPVRVVR